MLVQGDGRGVALPQVIMNLSIRLLILVLLAAVPVLAIQVNDLLRDREQRKAAIAEQALDLARLAAAQQDQFIEGARYLLAAAAQFPEVQSLDQEGCSNRMRELLDQFPTITGISAVGRDGVQFCSGFDSVSPTNLSDRPYLQQADRDKTLAISGYVIGRRSRRPPLREDANGSPACPRSCPRPLGPGQLDRRVTARDHRQRKPGLRR